MFSCACVRKYQWHTLVLGLELIVHCCGEIHMPHRHWKPLAWSWRCWSENIYTKYFTSVVIFFSIKKTCKELACFPLIIPISCDITLFCLWAIYLLIASYKNSWCCCLNVIYSVFSHECSNDVICIFWIYFEISIFWWFVVSMFNVLC